MSSPPLLEEIALFTEPYISTPLTVAITDTSSTAKVFVLPPAIQHPGRMLYIKDANFNAFYSTIFISTSLRDTIDNSINTNVPAYGAMSTNGGTVLLASDGLSNWMVLQHYILNTVSLSGAPQQYLFTGALQSYIVPVGVRRIFVQMWGAGGGGINGGIGAAGAYVEGFLNVTPGQVYTITVGKGGESPSSTTRNIIFGNGGTGGASGGGFSAIALSGTFVAIIAGGGGSTRNNTTGGVASFNGTGGGGVSFGDAGGGSLTAGGAGGSAPGIFPGEAGSLYTGGNGTPNGPDPAAGGGGGLYGGGGSASTGIGGGGSSLITNLTSVVGFNPTGQAAVNTTSPQYVSGCGRGVSNGAGGNGLVWITPS